jgi:hypothetical protein
VKRLLGHRPHPRFGTVYLVRWQGLDEDGNPWPDSWQPEENVGSAALTEYHGTLITSKSTNVTLSLAPAYEEMRKSIARAVCIDKTRAEPIVHSIDVAMLALEPLAVAMLKLISETTGSSSGSSAKLCGSGGVPRRSRARQSSARPPPRRSWRRSGRSGTRA